MIGLAGLLELAYSLGQSRFCSGFPGNSRMIEPLPVRPSNTAADVSQAAITSPLDWLGELYSTHRTCAFRNALSILENADEAEDVVHIVFLRLHLDFASRVPAAKQRAYIGFASRREARAILRSRYRQRSLTSFLATVPPYRTGPLEELLRESEIKGTCHEMITQLPPRCREVLTLALRDELTHSEIAGRLSISTKAVEKQMTRAYRNLRQMPEFARLHDLMSHDP